MTDTPKPTFLSPPKYEIDDLDFWRLCDELSIKEAALLIAGKSPSGYANVDNFPATEKPKGYTAARTGILNALRSGRIKGTIEPDYELDPAGNPVLVEGGISVMSRVDVESLKAWLISRGFRRGFFFPEEIDAQEYMDKNNLRFAPKLAAAVRAWRAVTDPGGKHPKQALTKWLRQNAAEVWLTYADGKLNELGIDEVAKVANWQLSGGAPKTPSGSKPPQD